MAPLESRIEIALTHLDGPRSGIVLDSSMSITVDTSAHPIVLVTFAGRSTDEEWAGYHTDMGDLMERARRSGNRIGVIVDGRTSEPPSALQRRRAAAIIEQQTPLLKVSSVGMALVLSSAIQRGVLTAFLWVRPFAVPHYVAATPEEAATWLRGELVRNARAS